MKNNTKRNFKFVSITTFSFQIIFLLAALFQLVELIGGVSIMGVLTLLSLLTLSFYSFKFGMDYRMKLAKDIIDAGKNDMRSKMNRRQRRKFKRDYGVTK